MIFLTMIQIRPTIAEDVSILSEFWYDNFVLLQQTNPLISVAPNAQKLWQVYISNSLANPDKIILTGKRETDVVGCIIGTVVDNSVGLLPPKLGLIEYLIVDLHTPQCQSGVGTVLWHAAKINFAERGIDIIRVDVAPHAAVQQAFWRGHGAQKRDDVFWISI